MNYSYIANLLSDPTLLQLARQVVSNQSMLASSYLINSPFKSFIVIKDKNGEMKEIENDEFANPYSKSDECVNNHHAKTQI